jgi:hypothetical protein
MMDLKLPQALQVLGRTPATLRSLLQGLSEDWILADEGPESFNPRDVLGHLIDGEETDWFPRLQIMLQHGEARPFDTFDRFAFREKYQDKTVVELLNIFERMRGQNLQGVKTMNLQPRQLDLKGSHPQLGAVTVRQLFATWVVHDLSHIAQITRVMSKQYKEAVGPWKDYISIIEWNRTAK